MKVGDHVDVVLSNGENLGPGKIVVSDAAATVRVTVERPRGGLFSLAGRSLFKGRIAGSTTH
jgi:hypothetical protein